MNSGRRTGRPGVQAGPWRLTDQVSPVPGPSTERGRALSGFGPDHGRPWEERGPAACYLVSAPHSSPRFPGLTQPCMLQPTKQRTDAPSFKEE